MMSLSSFTVLMIFIFAMMLELLHGMMHDFILNGTIHESQNGVVCWNWIIDAISVVSPPLCLAGFIFSVYFCHLD